MEHYTINPEIADEEEKTPTIEKLSGWVMGLQAEVRGQRPDQDNKPELAKPNANEQSKKELDFELRREIRDDPTGIHHGGMIAVGEVLADKTSDKGFPIGSVGVKQVSKQKKMANEESRATTKQSTPTAMNAQQAIQLGIAVGLTVALLILLWIAVQ